MGNYLRIENNYNFLLLNKNMKYKKTIDDGIEGVKYFNSLNIPLEDIIEKTAEEFASSIKKILEGNEVVANVLKNITEKVCYEITNRLTNKRPKVNPRILLKYYAGLSWLTFFYSMENYKKTETGSSPYKNIYEFLDHFKKKGD